MNIRTDFLKLQWLRKCEVPLEARNITYDDGVWFGISRTAVPFDYPAWLKYEIRIKNLGTTTR